MRCALEEADASTTSLDVANDISLSRFKQSLLSILHERNLAETCCKSLSGRLREASETSKSADLAAAEMRARFDEAMREQEEMERRFTAHRRASEDERSRHVLAVRLAKEKEKAQQQKLKEQGQQLYHLEESLRAQTTQAEKLAIEKDGADDLIGTFQSRLDGVGKVIQNVGKTEEACKAAISKMRAEHGELARRLDAAVQAQNAAAPRIELERRLKTALQQGLAAEERAREQHEELDAKEEELACAALRHEQIESELARAREGLAEAHRAALAHEQERRKLGEALLSAKAASLREQEKSDVLVRRLAKVEIELKVFHAEVRHVDREARLAETKDALAADDIASRLRAAETRIQQMGQLHVQTTAELEEARSRERASGARLIGLCAELDDLRRPRASSAGVASQLAAAPAAAATSAMILPAQPQQPQASIAIAAPSQEQPLAGIQPPEDATQRKERVVTTLAPSANQGEHEAVTTTALDSSQSVTQGGERSVRSQPSAVDEVPSAHLTQDAEQAGAARRTPEAEATSHPTIAPTEAFSAHRATAGENELESDVTAEPLQLLSHSSSPPPVALRPRSSNVTAAATFQRLPSPTPPSDLPSPPPPLPSYLPPHLPPPAGPATDRRLDGVHSSDATECMLCGLPLYGVSVSCGKCTLQAHAQCAGVSAQAGAAKKAYTCAGCQPKIAKRSRDPGHGVGSGGGGVGKRAKGSKTRGGGSGASINAHQQSLLSMV